MRSESEKKKMRRDISRIFLFFCVASSGTFGCRPANSVSGSHDAAVQISEANTSFPISVASNGTEYVLSKIKAEPEQITLNKKFSLMFVLEESAGRQPVRDDIEVHFDAVMPEHNHGLNYLPKVVLGEGGKVSVHDIVLHMAGRWQFHIDVTRNGITERTQWDVTI